jgi:hypothetical protein
MPLVLDGSQGVSSNGTVFSFVPNDSGFPLTPNRPSFSVSYSGGVTADGTIIPWNVTTALGRHNIGGHYNTGTGRFTAPVAGRYLFQAQVHHASGAGTPGTHHYFDFEINAVVASRFIGTWNFDNWYDQNHIVVFQLSAGDHVQVKCFQAQNQWMGSSRPDHNRFSGFLIG